MKRNSRLEDRLTELSSLRGRKKKEGENKKEQHRKKNGGLGGAGRNRALWDTMRSGNPEGRKKGAERVFEEKTKTKVDLEKQKQKPKHSFIHLRGSTKSK